MYLDFVSTEPKPYLQRNRRFQRMETVYVPHICSPCLVVDLDAGPTCKKMVDLTQDKIFKSCAFEPSQEDMSNARHAQQKQRQKQRAKPEPMSSPTRTPSTGRKVKTLDDIGDMSDSSDEELPDVKSLLDVVDKKPEGKGKGKAVRRIMDSDVRSILATHFHVKLMMCSG